MEIKYHASKDRVVQAEPSRPDLPLTHSLSKRSRKKQRIETLINEEALLLTKYLKDELRTWIARTRANAGVGHRSRKREHLSYLVARAPCTETIIHVQISRESWESRHIAIGTLHRGS